MFVFKNVLNCRNIFAQVLGLISTVRTHCDLVHAFAARQSFSKPDLQAALESVRDFAPTMESFHNLYHIVENQPASGSFWPQFLTVASELNRPLLVKAVSDFVLDSPALHNNATIMQVLRLLISDSRFEDVLSLYQFMFHRLTDAEQKAFVSDLISILGQTPYWESALPMLSLMVGHSRVNALRVICDGAARFSSPKTVLSVLENLPEHVGVPNDRLFSNLLSRFPSMSDPDNRLDELLRLMHRKHWIVSENTAILIATWFNSQSPQLYRATLSVKILEQNTKCPICNVRLPVFQTTNEMISGLAADFYQKALKGSGKDSLYLTTTPDELHTMNRFLADQTAPFDCIIDFLNLMHQFGVPFEPQKAGHFICEIIRTLNRDFNFRRFCLVSKGSRVIRHHSFWSRIKQLGNQTGVSVFSFITQNNSDDDVFMLYMALWSGPQCYLVSNDEFKQHRYTVGSQLGLQLSQWQAVRQIAFLRGRSKSYVAPLQHETRVHGTMATGWHIPYDNKAQRRSYVPPNLWLCVRPHPVMDNNDP
ncbi:hypothetical protein AHF37_05186 [Paragonimus kellicotti]|nr:hypothetical protein AHF37_05186 [Paragonimus kellicotti]